MTQEIQTYLAEISKLYMTGDAREHSYRGDLQNLLKQILPNILPTNEPARIDCGAPDYVLTKNNLPVGYIEAKDLGFDLNHKSFKEQFERYKTALNNMVFTNYLVFDFYRNGECIHSFEIAKVKNNKIMPLPENFDRFIACMQSFFNSGIEPVTDSKKLAKMMASKAKLLSEAIEKSLLSDEKNPENSSLHDQMQSFKKVLIHDITPKIFADIYAQTIAYGLFAARFHDTTPDSFSRKEAAELIPKSNPFLRKLFGFIADYELDSRIAWIIDALAEVFRATNIPEILANFGKSTQTHDPIIHFYETFLAEYDPALRKSRGVWYTPEAVVNFIVRSVDDVLKTEFNLPQGLADSSKTTIIKIDNTEQEVHKVQILDPATGTGTFLAQIIKHIHATFKNQQGMWTGYVEQHLIPRLNGFEILMASYAMAHLKMDMLLTETGYKPQSNQRFKIYLTNSLEKYHDKVESMFAQWLSAESAEANSIKRDAPVMCIIGNPPYNRSSQNKSDWILELIDDYKKEPNSNNKLGERNIQSLGNDYVKFIRYGQHFIEKNNFGGVLAYICPHGFLNDPTSRGMRYNLLKTYDTIYTIDLHGDFYKKEVCPDGSEDENVFDIKQGVSINLFIKTGKKGKNALATVYHYDVYGKRDFKYNFLNNNSLKSIPFVKLPNTQPNYFMVQKNFSEEENYKKGFSVNELFEINGTGVKFRKDSLLVKNHYSKQSVIEMINDINNLSTDLLQLKYNFSQSTDWQHKEQIINFKDYKTEDIKSVEYRPFDKRFCYYPFDKINKIIPRGDSRRNLIQHFLKGDNLGLIVGRQGQVVGSMPWNVCFISKTILDQNIFRRGGGNTYPLYLYPDDAHKENSGKGDLFGGGNINDDISKRKPNFDPVILEKIVTCLSLRFVADHEEDEFANGEAVIASEAKQSSTHGEAVKKVHQSNETALRLDCHGTNVPRNDDDGGFTSSKPTINPLDILDYIYAMLHSPTYRETYKEFLKIDFPKVPYPTDTQTFWQLVMLGREIRLYHLLEHPNLAKSEIQYPISDNNIITTKIASKDFIVDKSGTYGKIMINDTQYFDNIPVVAWAFYIGGYQPAQKWLKDRLGYELNYDDIIHYQKIIKSLFETYKLMQDIDAVQFLNVKSY